MILMQGITKVYRLSEVSVTVLKGIDISIQQGEYVAIMGASGSGKSTLMNIIGCLDRSTAGDYNLEGRDLMRLDDEQLAYVRNQRIGFVFQQFNLLPRSTALENVMLPMVYANIPKSKRRQRAIEVLTQVGLGNYLNNRPTQLSGGQQQRVAVARALVNDPALVLADEPTGALDSETSQEIMDLLTDLNRNGITIIVVTHDREVAAQTRRMIRLQDGLVISDDGAPSLLAPKY
jgi:putative ABC transport system ATP-binding protein